MGMRKAFSSSQLLYLDADCHTPEQLHTLQPVLERQSQSSSTVEEVADVLRRHSRTGHAYPSLHGLRVPLPPDSPRQRSSKEIRQDCSRGRAVSAALSWREKGCLAALVLAAVALLLPQLSGLWKALPQPPSPPQALPTGGPTALPPGCVGVPSMDTFDMTRFDGRWHQVAWLHGGRNTSKGELGRCMSANFSGNNSHGFQVSFKSQALRQPEASASSNSSAAAATPDPVRHSGTGHAPDTTQPGRLRVQLDDGAGFPLWLVHTDYHSFALLLSCGLPLGGLSGDQVFVVMSRSLSLDPMDVGDQLNRLADMGLPWQNVAFSPLQGCASLFL